MRNLPLMPEVLARIWQVSEEPQVGTAELSEVVGMDPGLVAEVLRAVNSAHFGLRASVKTLREAITLLGIRAVRNLSVTLLVRHGLLPRAHGPIQFDRLAFWRHCVATAVAAESFAHRLRWSHPGMAYTAGLLHDVGIMVLDHSMQRELGRILTLVDEGTPVLEADREVLGCTHADIARLLGEMWQFPREIVQCLQHHHDPFRADVELQRLACMVAMADALASPARPAVYGGLLAEERTALTRFLAIEEGALLAVRRETDAYLEKASHVLDLEIPRHAGDDAAAPRDRGREP